MATSNTTIDIKIDRLELIEALKKRLPEFKAADKENAAAHKQAERDWLAGARATLRELAKLGYEDLKQALTKRPYELLGGPPSCPVAQHLRCENLIGLLEKDTTTAYKLDAKDWRYLLAYGPLNDKTVCD
jgi:hypothetical protein